MSYIANSSFSSTNLCSAVGTEKNQLLTVQFTMPLQPQIAVAIALYLSFICILDGIEAADSTNATANTVVTIIRTSVQSNRRQRNGENASIEPEQGNNRPKKRRYIKWDWPQARAAVMRDYWGPNPNFSDWQFERVFRITRVIADRLLNVLGNEDPFFTQRLDGLGKLGICPKVKLLFALKLIAYVISPSGFQLYFQMGLPTARQCLMRFIFVVSNSFELQEH
jgi:hypothetical protein